MRCDQWCDVLYTWGCLVCNGGKHWSECIEWPAGRWDSIETAPTLFVHGHRPPDLRGRTKDGTVVEPMHFASDTSGDEQPPFHGWFVPVGNGFGQVHPVEWQPLTATP
jgi:hypothetical protein